ncbi:MAG: ADP-dependent NAD(P)H-hydrate dehydratase / NAD(P)H-hydrate epimerase [Bacillota bacterium]|nr:ADP-dependent NAD(P)H-hydrate dehydratase / NAD(P)H-hydrate epimerase [Bacillota bacterium]
MVTAAEMRAADEYTVREIGLPEAVLMEEAGRQVAELCLKLLKERPGRGRVFIWAGKGNNGGDGLVAARRLGLAGYHVEVFLVAEHPDALRGEARRNLEVLRRLAIPVNQAWSQEEIAAAEVVGASGDLQVDALLGTGARGAVGGPLAAAIAAINRGGVPVVAVDLPSGLDADTGEVLGPAVRASYTVTLGRPKVGLLTYPGAELVGKLYVADIGIPALAYPEEAPAVLLLEADTVAAWLPAWTPTTHKGERGRVFVVGGSPGLTGAACLAGEAALRAGAGLVTVGVPEGVHDIFEVKLTEVMTTPLPEAEDGTLAASAAATILERAAQADALAVGPGLGRGEELPSLLAELVRESQVPLVIDADGLNALAGQLGVLGEAAAPLILTPHPGELARLTRSTPAEAQAHRLPLARDLAREWKAVVVLKGARTVIAAPDGTCYINPTGNPGLATGGTGDVLTGVIAALLAQGLEPVQAAAAGVFLHGLAGDLAAERVGGERGLVAGDVLSALPSALAAVLRGEACGRVVHAL